MFKASLTFLPFLPFYQQIRTNRLILSFPSQRDFGKKTVVYTAKLPADLVYQMALVALFGGERCCVMLHLCPPQMALLSEVYTVASLIIVMPATNAVSERSFSALRHLKLIYDPR